jgi:hypothetical protein
VGPESGLEKFLQGPMWNILVRVVIGEGNRTGKLAEYDVKLIYHEVINHQTNNKISLEMWDGKQI